MRTHRHREILYITKTLPTIFTSFSKTVEWLTTMIHRANNKEFLVSKEDCYQNQNRDIPERRIFLLMSDFDCFVQKTILINTKHLIAEYHQLFLQTFQKDLTPKIH